MMASSLYFVIFLFLSILQEMYATVTMHGIGEYIFPNVCYIMTCSYEIPIEDRITVYNILDENNNGVASFTVRYLNSTGQCFYRNPSYVPCKPEVCSCDTDGHATHFCYYHTSSFNGTLTIACFSGSSDNIKVKVAERYNLKGSPQNLKVGEKANITLSCATIEQYVKWQRKTLTIAVITGIAANGSCLFSGTPNPLYWYTCDPNTYIYNISISVAVEDQLQNTQWGCGPLVGDGSSMFRFSVNVPVTSLTITPAVTNDIINVAEGQTQTFTCTTDSCRPAAWIQWYIGTLNITNQAEAQTHQQDGEKFISSSRLVYTWRQDDHNKYIYCEAINIDGVQKIKSSKIRIYIQSDFILTGSDPFIINDQPFTLNCSSNVAPRGEVAYFYKDNISTINIRYIPSTSTCYGIPQDGKPVFQCNDTCSCSEDARIFTWTYNGTVTNQRVTFKCEMDFGTDQRNVTYREVTVERAFNMTPPITSDAPTREPDAPSNVFVVCKEMSMTVFWRPGFNGDDIQKFKVLHVNNQTNQTTTSQFMPDQGGAETMMLTIESLDPETLYIVSVQASNTHGTVASENVNCTTSSGLALKESDKISAVGIGAGIGSAIKEEIQLKLVQSLTLTEQSAMYEATQYSSDGGVNIYNELQHAGTDSSIPDQSSSDTSIYYNESGIMTNRNTEHYQNINRTKEEPALQNHDPPMYLDLNIQNVA
ncbi:unnamed protein product [Mytilus coruscus]|uniref:Ig-like domain-containing protein n=1 Tax=Mytilus coruscus TaxID=42192 RepID=A0A6J8EMS9_MYTCO|nr:unnamed protein product [Mytilus coruscus]